MFYDYVNSCAWQLSIVSREVRTLVLLEKLQSPEFLGFLYWYFILREERLEDILI